MARLVILKTGSTLPPIEAAHGDFDRWFLAGLSDQLDTLVVDVTTEALPGKPFDWDGIVVTGSPAMVSDRADWSEATAQWLAQAVEDEIPVLGVCYGHQLLAHALGGKVGYHPEGRESGTHWVDLLDTATNDPLLGQLPTRFQAQLTHKQSVLELPDSAVLLAKNSFEPHQAFRVGSCAWGVQFHPEFTADVMRAYLQVQAPELAEENQSPDSLLSAVADAPFAASLLKRFSAIVAAGR